MEVVLLVVILIVEAGKVIVIVVAVAAAAAATPTAIAVIASNSAQILRNRQPILDPKLKGSGIVWVSGLWSRPLAIRQVNPC